jgi:predicted DNA-binding antitoxin AbrB/MazE fold protein
VSTTVEAIYENGKLILPQSLPLPEHTHVRVTIETNDISSDEERAAWSRLSEESLSKTWGNQGDDIFNDLLKK